MEGVIIQLAGGYLAICDEEDASLVSQYRWSTVKGASGIIYAIYNRWKSRFYMHQLIMGTVGNSTVRVDHIDRDGLNNRRSNLRIVGRRENLWNMRRHKDNESGFKGVSKNTNGSGYSAFIKINGKNIYLGTFPLAQLAHEAYVRAAKKYFGEFAREA